MGLFFVLAIIVLAAVSFSNLYTDITVFKHKKRYFMVLGTGLLSRFPLIKLCFVFKHRRGFNIALVRKRGYLRGISLDSAPKADRELLSAVFKNMKVILMDADIVLGLDEAKNTAMCCGMLSSLLDFINKKFVYDRKNSRYSVSPSYDATIFTIKLRCIFKFNLVKSMAVYLKNKIKRRCNENESYSGSYADNDG